MIDGKYDVSLAGLVEEAMNLLSIADIEKRDKLIADVQEFFRLRIKNVLTDENIRYDIIDAVLATGMDNIYAVYLKAIAVTAEIEERDMTKAIQAFVRVGNLAKKAKAAIVKAELFITDEEKNLYQAYVSVNSAVESLIEGKDYAGAIDAMMDLIEPIDNFFDNVMVMDKEEAIKTNRLALLSSITNMVNQVADFSKIV